MTTSQFYNQLYDFQKTDSIVTVKFDHSTLSTAPKAAMEPNVIYQISYSVHFQTTLDISYGAKESDIQEQLLSKLDVSECLFDYAFFINMLIIT